jgi:hypothetical protein
VNATSQDDGWAHLGAVGSYLGATVSSFDSRNYGFSKLITLARDQDFLDVEDNPPRVRLRANRPAKQAAKQAGKKAAKKTSKKTAKKTVTNPSAASATG